MKIVTWVLQDEIYSYLLESNVDYTVLVEVLRFEGALQIKVENIKARTQKDKI